MIETIEQPKAVTNGSNGQKPFDTTRLLFRLGVCMEALGFSPNELRDLNEAQFEAAIGAKAAEMKSLAPDRTEIQDIMMEPLELNLAGKTYQVHPHKIHDEKKWLRALGRIAGIISGSLAPIIESAAENKGKINLGDIDLEAVISGAIPRIFEFGIPEAVELMLNYSAELAADREIIMALPLSERSGAALKVFKFAFPQMLANLKSMIGLFGEIRGMAS